MGKANTNLGATNLRRRRRNQDPMQAYDALPEPLRQWMANAAMPWSPAACRRVWSKARRKGLSAEETLNLLSTTERKTLLRHQQYQISDI